MHIKISSSYSKVLIKVESTRLSFNFHILYRKSQCTGSLELPRKKLVSAKSLCDAGAGLSIPTSSLGSVGIAREVEDESYLATNDSSGGSSRRYGGLVRTYVRRSSS